MDFYEVIENRASVKKYRNNSIKEEKLTRMINAAMLSPSWRNNTSYKIILINDQREKEMLANAIINETNEAANAVREAPLTVVFVAEPDASGNIEGREYYLVDGAIAMEHFVLAAANEGYDTCWIASIDEDKVRKALSIPNNYRVVALTPVGEGAEGKEHHIKKDVRKHVFLNTWGNPYTENDSEPFRH